MRNLLKKCCLGWWLHDQDFIIAQEMVQLSHTPSGRFMINICNNGESTDLCRLFWPIFKWANMLWVCLLLLDSFKFVCKVAYTTFKLDSVVLSHKLQCCYVIDFCHVYHADQRWHLLWDFWSFWTYWQWSVQCQSQDLSWVFCWWIIRPTRRYDGKSIMPFIYSL